MRWIKSMGSLLSAIRSGAAAWLLSLALPSRVALGGAAAVVSGSVYLGIVRFEISTSRGLLPLTATTLQLRATRGDGASMRNGRYGRTPARWRVDVYRRAASGSWIGADGFPSDADPEWIPADARHAAHFQVEGSNPLLKEEQWFAW